jgi:hypothetical protein
MTLATAIESFPAMASTSPMPSSPMSTAPLTRIDLNDPTVSGQETVERDLGYASAAPTAKEE